MSVDLSIIIPVISTPEALERVAAQLPMACAALPEGTRWELIVGATAGVALRLESLLAKLPDARMIIHDGKYGTALRAAIKESRAPFLLTMEPGLAHSPFVIPELFAHRHSADFLVASRYIRTGFANAGFVRRALSRLLNRTVRFVLDFPVRDLTSSFRLYRRQMFSEFELTSEGFEILTETLVCAYAQGFRLQEIPFHYFPVHQWLDSDAGQVGRDILRHLGPLWRLRNSIDCADYDERAFRSRIWFQRSWQRRRYHALMHMARDSEQVLDVGCGSSQVLDGLPQAYGCDVRQNKLRHKRDRSRQLVRASVFALPYRSEYFDAVVFSQVIEHLPRDPQILHEVIRVARPGGYVIVGTPDYATWWTTVEKIYGFVHPSGYADEHITHYTFDTLRREVESYGCTYVDHAYVWGGELIMRFRKNGAKITSA